MDAQYEELMEALQYALIAIKSDGPLEVLDNFGLDAGFVRAAGEGVGDPTSFSVGLLAGMILERRRTLA